MPYPMQLSPRLYRWLIRPQWLTNLYINNLIDNNISTTDQEVLDFGCGTGSSCILFAPENYLGVDINQNRVNYAQQLYPNYQFQSLTDNKQLPFTANSFDQILIVAVLHHISTAKLNSLLSHFHQILKPDGKIIIIEPCLIPEQTINNYFMQLLDNGDYIRKPKDYFTIFNQHDYDLELIKQYSKLFFYQELFFTAEH